MQVNRSKSQPTEDKQSERGVVTLDLEKLLQGKPTVLSLTEFNNATDSGPVFVAPAAVHAIY